MRSAHPAARPVDRPPRPRRRSATSRGGVAAPQRPSSATPRRGAQALGRRRGGGDPNGRGRAATRGKESGRGDHGAASHRRAAEEREETRRAGGQPLRHAIDASRGVVAAAPPPGRRGAGADAWAARRPRRPPQRQQPPPVRSASWRRPARRAAAAVVGGSPVLHCSNVASGRLVARAGKGGGEEGGEGVAGRGCTGCRRRARYAHASPPAWYRRGPLGTSTSKAAHTADASHLPRRPAAVPLRSATPCRGGNGRPPWHTHPHKTEVGTTGGGGGEGTGCRHGWGRGRPQGHNRRNGGLVTKVTATPPTRLASNGPGTAPRRATVTGQPPPPLAKFRSRKS